MSPTTIVRDAMQIPPVIILIAQEFQKSEKVRKITCKNSRPGRPSNGFLLFLSDGYKGVIICSGRCRPENLTAEMITARRMMTGKKYLRTLWGLFAILILAATAWAQEAAAP